MEIGRFYERRRQWLAATLRFRKVVDDYQTTTHAPEALMRLTETYLALGVRNEAEKSAAVLGANYPGTDWYQRAYKLVGDNPVTPIAPLAPGEPVLASQPVQSIPGSQGVTPKAESPGAPTPATTAGGGGNTEAGSNPTTSTPDATQPGSPNPRADRNAIARTDRDAERLGRSTGTDEVVTIDFRTRHNFVFWTRRVTANRSVRPRAGPTRARATIPHRSPSSHYARSLAPTNELGLPNESARCWHTRRCR